MVTGQVIMAVPCTPIVATIPDPVMQCPMATSVDGEGVTHGTATIGVRANGTGIRRRFSVLPRHRLLHRFMHLRRRQRRTVRHAKTGGCSTNLDSSRRAERHCQARVERFSGRGELRHTLAHSPRDGRCGLDVQRTCWKCKLGADLLREINDLQEYVLAFSQLAGMVFNVEVE